ncbi:MAG: helicase-related protein, partial [Rhodothermales bacterium]|nr:helicase-related protein [Rhodothermales bacterium]
ALIQESVEFKRLGLAVIDEQHRFGVMQRARIFSKGENPHILLMTATPIPRSLAMTLYGDLDVSIIRGMPPGRTPVETRLYFDNRRDDMYKFVAGEISAGRRAYVVYPLVEESEKLDLKDAQSGVEKIRKVFPHARVDLVHGRMKSEEKDAAMRRFKSGATNILVATTVIEVGVDIPNATVMVVEHAERFGLSQLHQLRGRVGRGSEKSYCLLMADYKRSAESRERLEALVRTTDGFEISEIDLRIRGAGDFFGTRQSGLPDLRIADLTTDTEILSQAREAASRLLREDPYLSHEHHGPIRDYFERFFVEGGMQLARVG